MRTKTFWIFALIALIVMPVAYAYPVTISLNSNMNSYETSIYRCSDNSCSSFTSGGQVFTPSNNQVSYVITGSGNQATAEYDYAGCQLPQSYVVTTTDNTGPGPWNFDIPFSRGQNCKAGFLGSSLPPNGQIGTPSQFTLTVDSPISPPPGAPLSVPSSIRSNFSPDVKVVMTVRDSSNNIVFTQTINDEILHGTQKNVQFTWTPTQSGQFRILFNSTVTDCMCSNTIPQELTHIITVPGANQPPVAIIDSNVTSGTAPLDVQFNSSRSFDSDGTIASRLWNFGDGSGAFGIDPAHRYFNPGSSPINFTVTLRVTDNQGATATATRIITVNPSAPVNQPPVAIFDSNVTTGTAPMDVLFNASRSFDPDGTIVGYGWNFGDGGFGVTNIPTIDHVYTAPGNYTVTLIVTDNQGATGSTTRTIRVNPRAIQLNVTSVSCLNNIVQGSIQQCSVTINTNQCPNTQITLRDISNSQQLASCNTFNGQSCTASFQENRLGTFTVYATATHPNCLNDLDTIPNSTYTVLSGANQPPVAIIQANVTSGNTPLHVQFTGSGSFDPDGTITAFFWNFGDGTTSTLANPAHIYSSTGNFTTTLTVTDNRGATGTASITITARQAGNQAPTAIIDTNVTRGIIPVHVQFNSSRSFDNDGNITSRLWNFGDGTTSTLIAPTHVFNTPGNYTVTLTVTDNQGATGSASIRIEALRLALNVTGLQCFDNAIVGDQQACSVRLNTNLCNGTLITIRDFTTENALGTCIADPISGACTALYNLNTVGAFTVYATATHSSCENDLDKTPTFNYRVFPRRYNITDLKVFNDSNFLNEDYDFFRNENMFVKFTVQDTRGNNINNLVTQVTLVSPPGGHVNLTEIDNNNGVYRYKLTPIPPTHLFLGNSQIFTFAFNFTDNSGAVKSVNLTIRNNPPQIRNLFQSIELNSTTTINLAPFEFDIEDSGSNLTWRANSLNNSVVEATVNGKTLTLRPVNKGNATVELKLFDLDNDFDLERFVVMVKNRPPRITSTPPTVVEFDEKPFTYTYDVEAVDPDNDTITFFLAQAPVGMSINSTTGLITFPIDRSKIGVHRVVVVASDGTGSDTQTYDLIVIEVGETTLSKDKIFFNRLDIVNGECVEPGDYIEVIVAFTNQGRETMKQARISVNIDELALMAKSGRFRAKPDRKVQQSLFLEIPSNAQPGWYDVRVSAGDDFYHRTKYRELIIKDSCKGW